MQPSDDPSGFFPLQDMWSHKEINQVDCSANGEVTSVVYLNNYIFSGMYFEEIARKGLAEQIAECGGKAE